MKKISKIFIITSLAGIMLVQSDKVKGFNQDCPPGKSGVDCMLVVQSKTGNCGLKPVNPGGHGWDSVGDCTPTPKPIVTPNPTVKPVITPNSTPTPIITPTVKIIDNNFLTLPSVNHGGAGGARIHLVK